MKMLALSFLALLAVSFVESQDCKAGDVWADGKIKMECSTDGTKPTACLPNGKLGDNELKPGQEFSTASFKFLCSSKGELSLSYDVIACILPNGKTLEIGKQEGIANKGLYNCVRNADNTVSRKYQAGCFFDGKLYNSGQLWNSGKGQVVCVAGQNGYEAQASGCILENGQVVKLESYGEQPNKDKVRCLVDGKSKYVAMLVKVSEKEYNEWLEGVAAGEEEAAGGDSASGLKRTTTTTTTTTTPTTTPTTTTTTTTPTTTTTTTKPTTTRTTTTTTPTTTTTTTKPTTTRTTTTTTPTTTTTTTKPTTTRTTTTTTPTTTTTTTKPTTTRTTTTTTKPTTTRTTTTTTKPTTTRTTTTTKPTTTRTTTTTKPTTTTKKTTPKPTPPPCADLHPVCEDLCRNCPSADREAVGFALEKRFIRPTTTRPPRKQCDIADASYGLISAICPKSCGFCGRADLKKATEKWNAVSCNTRNQQEESVGFSLE